MALTQVSYVPERQVDVDHKYEMAAAAEARAANAQTGNVHRAGDQQTAPKLQLLTRPTPEIETIPYDYNRFLAQWERNRDSCPKPKHHNALAIVL